MTYLESLATLKRLRDFVCPYDPEWFITFEFTTETDFIIHFNPVSEWLIWLGPDATKGQSAKDCPFAKMVADPNNESVWMHYSDQAFMCEYDLIFDRFLNDEIFDPRYIEWKLMRSLESIFISGKI